MFSAQGVLTVYFIKTWTVRTARRWKTNTFLVKNVSREPSARIEVKRLMSEGFTERKIKEKCEVPENLGFPFFSQKFKGRDREGKR